MDSNNLPYFLLRTPEEFENGSSRLTWDARRGALVLAQNQELRLPTTSSAASLARLQTAKPLVFDRYGQLCRIHTDGTSLEYNAGRGYLPLVDGELLPVTSLAGQFTDLAIGAEGRLAAGYSDGTAHGLLVFHLAKRWQVAVELPEQPLRVWIDSDANIWVLAANSLIQCAGEPLPHTYVPRTDRFEPVAINPRPLRVINRFYWRAADLPVQEQQLALLAAIETPLAIGGDDEQLYVLAYTPEGIQTIITLPLSGNRLAARRYLVDPQVGFAVDIGIADTDRLALLTVRNPMDSAYLKRDCPVVQLVWKTKQATGAALLIGERYPMLSQAEPRFVASADKVLRYQAVVAPEDEEHAAGFTIRPRELHALQRPRYYTDHGETPLEVLDSGMPNRVWHRIYLEGCIPPGTRLKVYVKSYNSPTERATAPLVPQPDWLWCSHRSDQPFGKGLVDARPGESGLFEILLQRNTGRVRRITGRYLQLWLKFESDGYKTPSVHALKVYYPRFSYQEAYLPEHFRQEEAVDTEQVSPANGADVRERLLASVEAVWTPLESQIASAELLLHPQFTPEEHLPWLGEALGQNLPDHWPAGRRRRWLAETGNLQRLRGTSQGLRLALDIITDGAVARGQIVLVENFLLRRTMATILGLNMEDEEHPLTLGTGVSGNSIVGDSLILADEQQRDFIALFAPGLANSTERKLVANFFDRYANQVTVLLHGDARRFKPVVEATLDQEMPAHLVWRVVETDHPFVLGLAPLLGVDTYLEHQPPARPVILDDTWLGREGLLKNPAAFSPRDVHSRTS